VASNYLYRVYPDEETMLAVYKRRLSFADRDYDKGRSVKESFVRKYQGKAEDDQLDTAGHLVSNSTGIAIIDTMFSSMVAVDVEFSVGQLAKGTRQQAKIAEHALNQAFRDSKGQRKARRAIKDAELTDIGWVKVYYEYVEDTEVRDVTDEVLKAQLEEIAEREGISAQDVVRNFGEELKLTEEVEVVLRDRVCVDYVPWKSIRFDPTAESIEECRWVAQYTRLPVPEVARNPLYRAFMEDRYGVEETKRLLDDLEGDGVAAGLGAGYEDIESLGLGEEEDDSRVTVVEFWDLETGLVTLFPRTRDDIVLHQRINPLMFNVDLEDRNPFKPLVLRSVPGQLEGHGDMRAINTGLEELDLYRTQMAEHVSRTIPKILASGRAFSPQGKTALQSREWMEVVEMEEGKSPSADTSVLEIPALTQEIYGVPAQVKDEMEAATGANEVLRGVFTSKRQTATETERVADAGERRQAERRGVLEEWYLDIAKTMLQLIQKFYDQERVMRYTDDRGEDFTWAFTNEDIAIEADLQISLTPAERPTRDQRFQRALQVMNLTLPIPETDRAEVMRFVLEEAGVPDEVVRRILKTPEEVEAERQKAQVDAQLATAPQPFGNSPAGLKITPGGA
jgi:hypothetical protein